jgi:hypothetical protein
LVPIGTSVASTTGEATEPVMSGGEGEATAIVEEEATGEATEEEAIGEESTATPEIEDEELAETGLGWGLILVSGVGLAGVAVAARRLRLAG